MRIDLSGPDGNAFAIMGIVKQYLEESGQGDQVRAFMDEATSGDYEHLLDVALQCCPDLEFEGL